MAAINLSVPHGQTIEVATENFGKTIRAASVKYSRWIAQAELSDDGRSAKLTGSGYRIDLTVDELAVHAKGNVPLFVKMFEGRIKELVESTLGKGDIP